MRKTFLVWFAFLLCSTPLIGQIPTKGNVFAGYSYLNAGSGLNLNGWTGSLEGRIFPHVGMVADISGHYTSDFGERGIGVNILNYKARSYTALFGPRVSAQAGNVRPFVHVLAGVAHSNERYTAEPVSPPGQPTTPVNRNFTENKIATAIGGGVDFSFAEVLGWRVQGDFLRTTYLHGDNNNFRFSTGLVLHF